MKKSRRFYQPRSLSLLICFVAPGSYGATTWYYGVSDNSANFGVTADASVQTSWQDNWFSGIAPSNPQFGSAGLQVNQPAQFADQPSLMAFGFDGLASAGVNSLVLQNATLYLRQDFQSLDANQNTAATWEILGIDPVNPAFDVPNATFDNLDASGPTPWSGGDITDSLTGSYGTFQSIPSTSDVNIAVDITDALRAYLDGDISGIVFVNTTPRGLFNPPDNRFVVYSDDNPIATNRPGLLVDVIPEPSSSILLCLASIVGISRRNRRS